MGEAEAELGRRRPCESGRARLQAGIEDETGLAVRPGLELQTARLDAQVAAEQLPQQRAGGGPAQAPGGREDPLGASPLGRAQRAGRGPDDVVQLSPPDVDLPRLQDRTPRSWSPVLGLGAHLPPT